ncbi:UNVERIFIED_CONTAM: hypothetical protein FKN15_070224 [Acipenser sinensis]
MSLLSCFIKRDVLENTKTVLQMLKLDPLDKTLHVPLKQLDISFATKQALDKASQKLQANALGQEFKKECITFLVTTSKKLLERSPLMYPATMALVRCLPVAMLSFLFMVCKGHYHSDTDLECNNVAEHSARDHLLKTGPEMIQVFDTQAAEHMQKHHLEILFNRYGENGSISIEGLKKLLESIGLDRIKKTMALVRCLPVAMLSFLFMVCKGHYHSDTDLECNNVAEHSARDHLLKTGPEMIQVFDTQAAEHMQKHHLEILFNRYGENGSISIEGLKKLLESIGLDRIKKVPVRDGHFEIEHEDHLQRGHNHHPHHHPHLHHHPYQHKIPASKKAAETPKIIRNNLTVSKKTEDSNSHHKLYAKKVIHEISTTPMYSTNILLKSSEMRNRRSVDHPSDAAGLSTTAGTGFAKRDVLETTKLSPVSNLLVPGEHGEPAESGKEEYMDTDDHDNHGHLEQEAKQDPWQTQSKQDPRRPQVTAVAADPREATAAAADPREATAAAADPREATAAAADPREAEAGTAARLPLVAEAGTAARLPLVAEAEMAARLPLVAEAEMAARLPLVAEAEMAARLPLVAEAEMAARLPLVAEAEMAARLPLVAEAEMAARLPLVAEAEMAARLPLVAEAEMAARLPLVAEAEMAAPSGTTGGPSGTTGGDGGHSGNGISSSSSGNGSRHSGNGGSGCGHSSGL